MKSLIPAHVMATLTGLKGLRKEYRKLERSGGEKHEKSGGKDTGVDLIKIQCIET